jgi:hypothetical protein
LRFLHGGDNLAQDHQWVFFIELGTRRIHLAGCTTNPEAIWVTQQAVIDQDIATIKAKISDLKFKEAYIASQVMTLNEAAAFALDTKVNEESI